MGGKSVVIDANILIRAVLGQRVRDLLEVYAAPVNFFVPDIALTEAEEHLETLMFKRGGDPALATRLLRALADLATVVGREVYGAFEVEARHRLANRDLDDWPILAAALALDCGVWTEDQDFFGCGVATWTTTNIESFLSA